MNRRPLRLIAAAYAAVVLWATIGPAPWRTNGIKLEGGILNADAWAAPVTWTTGLLSEMAFNVAIFIPVGVLAALLIARRWWPLAFVAGSAFSLVIELVQVVEPDRISDPRDLVMNTAGAAFGVLIVLAARIMRRAGGIRTAPTVVLAGGVAADGGPVLTASADGELVLAASADRAA